MAEDREDGPVVEGVGDPAREKTVAERPVSDQDIEDIRDDLEEVNDDLDDLQSKGDRTF